MKPTLTLFSKARICLLATILLLTAGVAARAQYCPPAFLTGCSADDDIHTFTLTGESGTSIIDSNTGCSANAYRLMTNLSASLAQGSVYTGFVSSEYFDEGVQVYIDLNNDNTFAPSETVGGVNYVDDIGTNFQLYIPASAPLGAHRMRVVLSYDFLYPNISACPTTQYYEYGEVHDYSVIIVAGTGGPACAAPAALSASAITSTGAQLWWSPVAGAPGYEYVIDQSSNVPAGAGTAIATNSLTAAGLSTNLQYHLHVRAKCGATNFSPWITRPFVTDDPAAVCQAPGGLTATVSGTQATISWSAVPATSGYEIFLTDVPNLYPLNGTAWTGTSATYTGLAPYTEYYAYLRHECSGGTVSNWAVLTLTAGAPGLTTGISGNLFSDDYPFPSVDTYKVWLIRYDSASTSLTAIDSMMTDGGSYAFSGMASGTYFVKAAQETMVPNIAGLGQVPTYHDSSLYWGTALPQQITTGTTLTNRHIWMRMGAVTSGPGFIGGNVSLGANKGTTSGVPNLLILLRNPANKLVKAVYTDAAGNFSLNNLPVGTYSVYPEKMGYATTPAITITLTAAQASRTGIDFNQDDAQENIKPRTTSITQVSTLAAGLAPNPAKGSVRVFWSSLTGPLHVDIANTTGQTVRAQAIETSGRTSHLLDITGLPAGLYTVRLQSGVQSTVGKLVVTP